MPARVPGKVAAVVVHAQFAHQETSRPPDCGPLLSGSLRVTLPQARTRIAVSHMPVLVQVRHIRRGIAAARTLAVTQRVYAFALCGRWLFSFLH